MIKVAGAELAAGTVQSLYPRPGIEQDILKKLASGSEIYGYESMEQLKFELAMRNNIINDAIKLYRGRLRFRVFRESECNGEFWNRMENGGFGLKPGIKPSEGIADIFRNTPLYGTECATAIVIIFYKAVLDIYPGELFDRTFPGIMLMNWMYLDNPLGVATYRALADYLPGDCRYFKNPDVDPLTPEWQGENAIDLDNGAYYGHGIGITDGDRIIAALNKNRIEGSTVSAYLTNTATRPDFKGLFAIYGKI